MVRCALALLALTACGFEAPDLTADGDDSMSDGPSDDAPGDGTDTDGNDDAADDGGDGITPDASLAITDDVVHLGTADETISTGELRLDGELQLDTTSLAASLPAGVTLTTAPHDPASGPELAVLRADTVIITGAGSLRVVGDRPLLILANRIQLDGVIDAGARTQQAGPGAIDMGPAAGGAGVHAGQYDDTGASGGGHGGAGGSGGDVQNNGGDVQGPAGGQAVNADLAILHGGARGGASWFTSAPTQCERRGGGGGGGAVQLYARTSITIGASGVIQAGGGGGRGGFACEMPYNWYGGHGGGAGGSIYLQAPTVTNDGRLAANGGGGGAGGGAGADGVNPGESGRDGENGGLGSARAAGGANTGIYSADGGRGGAGEGGPEDGKRASSQGNGGGGGGGVGRIVIRYRDAQRAGAASPAAAVATY